MAPRHCPLAWRYKALSKMERFTLELPNGISVSPELQENEVSSKRDVTKHDMGNGYVWYFYTATSFKSEDVSFSFCFLNQTIMSLNIALSDKEKYGSGWDDFSEEKEKLRAFDTKIWLNKTKINPSCKSWGDLSVGYDSKGGCGSAIIRFRRAL